MKQLVLISLFAIATTIVSNANAVPITVKANWDVTIGKTDGDRRVDDFHVTIKSDTTMTLTESFSLGNTFGNKPNPGTTAPSTSIPLNWFSANRILIEGSTFHVGVTVTEDSYNEIRPEDPYLTDDIGRRIGDAVITGFKAERQSPLSFTLFNDLLEQVEITSLAFKYSLTETALSDLLPFTISGFTPITGSIFISPGSSSSPFDLGNIPANGYLLVEGTARGVTSGLTSNFMFEHQDIPEPSTLFLSLFGIPLLLRKFHGQGNAIGSIK